MLRLAQPFADHHINIFHFDPNGSGVHHRDPFYKLVGNRIIIFRKAQRLLLQPRLHLPLPGGPQTPPAFIFFKSLHLIQKKAAWIASSGMGPTEQEEAFLR